METLIIRLEKEDIDKLLQNKRLYYGVEADDCDFCSEEIIREIQIQLIGD